MILHDLRCPKCGRIDRDVRVTAGRYGRCASCGSKRNWMPSQVVTDLWGGPRFLNGLDMEFRSRSDLKAYMKANHLMEAGDKKGGARNEEHLHLGRAYSYDGQRGRGNNPLAK